MGARWSPGARELGHSDSAGSRGDNVFTRRASHDGALTHQRLSVGLAAERQVAEPSSYVAEAWGMIRGDSGEASPRLSPAHAPPLPPVSEGPNDSEEDEEMRPSLAGAPRQDSGIDQVSAAGELRPISLEDVRPEHHAETRGGRRGA